MIHGRGQCEQLVTLLLGHTPSTAGTFRKKFRKNSGNWRQIWRVAGRESGSPELLGSPRASPQVPRTSPELFGDFPGSSLTVELNCNPEVPRKFPKLSRKFPGLPRKFRDFPGGQPLPLGSLTPSSDSQKLSLRKDSGNALRAFPGISLESTAGMPQTL